MCDCFACMFMCVPCVEDRGRKESLVTGVTDGYRPSYRWWELSWVLCMSIKCSKLLRELYSPSSSFWYTFKESTIH